MFDVGFWELAIIAIVGIVVVGPNRLPEVVRTLAITLRKMRRMFSDVKADISRELDLDNMRKFMREAEIEDHIKQLNQSVIDLGKDEDLNHPVKDVKDSIESSRTAVNHLLNDPFDGANDDTSASPEQRQKAIEHADTGVEIPQHSRFSPKSNNDATSSPPDKASTTSNPTSSSDNNAS